MKYRKKFIICSLLAGLTALTDSCGSKPLKPELISAKILPRFPSASAIEYGGGKIFLFGDDAAYLLVLDTAYRLLDTVRYINDTAYRIAKQNKPDIEAAALLSVNHQTYLCALGSFSTGQRRKVFAFPLNDLHSFFSLTDSALLQSLSALPEINIEGFTTVKSSLVLANRANTTHKMNKLVIMNNILFQAGTLPEAVVTDLVMKSEKTIGVSGLYYVEEKDMLLFTASEEDTPSATQDGVIGDSYIGWIYNFSKKTKAGNIYPDRMINLSTVNALFKKQKIESVCVEGINGGEAIVYLAADNDNGQSKLFKMKLRFE